MAKIGPKELRLRELAKGKASMKRDDLSIPDFLRREPRASDVTAKAMVDAVDAPKTTKAADPPPPEQKESKQMPTKKQRKAAAKRSARKAVRAKTTKPRARSADRSPLAVGEYIVANSPTTEQLSKHFGVDSHPMRSKIFDARHKLGFTIEHKDGRYAGEAPKFKASA